jgi:hypothetical protein
MVKFSRMSVEFETRQARFPLGRAETPSIPDSIAGEMSRLGARRRQGCETEFLGSRISASLPSLSSVSLSESNRSTRRKRRGEEMLPMIWKASIMFCATALKQPLILAFSPREKEEISDVSRCAKACPANTDLRLLKKTADDSPSPKGRGPGEGTLRPALRKLLISMIISDIHGYFRDNGLPRAARISRIAVPKAPPSQTQSNSVQPSQFCLYPCYPCYPWFKSRGVPRISQIPRISTLAVPVGPGRTQSKPVKPSQTSFGCVKALEAVP